MRFGTLYKKGILMPFGMINALNTTADMIQSMQSSISGHQLQGDNWIKRDEREGNFASILAGYIRLLVAYLSSGTTQYQRVNCFTQRGKAIFFAYFQVTNLLQPYATIFLNGCWRSNIFLLLGGYCDFRRNGSATGAKSCI